MSRIYTNEPLQSLAIQNAKWKYEWNESSFSGTGQGVIVECIVRNRSRIAITDTTSQKYRYLLLHVDITKAHNRQFDQSGKEVEPNFSDSEKLRTGYLNSSYKVAAKGKTDQLSKVQVTEKLNVKELRELVTSSDDTLITLWVKESQCSSIELSNGNKVRLKSKGDSPFIETIGKIDQQTATVNNFTSGESVGNCWTDKVMNVKQQQLTSNTAAAASSTGDGADDDEWDD